jgi:ketosteroid isomerase-like protein
MLSLREISDRLEIEQLFTDYSYAIDGRDWDALDRVFTPDAVIDYTEMGGPRGSLAETKAFLAEAMSRFAGFQHLVATSQIRVHGDTAQARSICFNPMLLDEGAPEPRVFFCGLWYRDTLTRTAEGWRICERYEEKGYFHNAPAALSAAARPASRP